MQEAREAAGIVDGVIVTKLTPRKKRILVTNAIGDCHIEIISSLAYYCAFISRGTLMPVCHLMSSEGRSVDNVSEDHEVKFQHLPQYNYAGRWTREKGLLVVEEICTEQENGQTEIEGIATERREVIEDFEVRVCPCVERT